MDCFKELTTACPKTKITVTPDYFVLTDGTAATVPSLLEGVSPKYPGKVKVFIDHETPCGTEVHAGKQRKLIRFARDQGCDLYNGYGIAYQLMLDRYVQAGNVVAHCGSFGSMYGAAGAYGVELTPEGMAQALVTGTVEVTVPQVCGLELTGRLSSPACGKDAALAALPLLGDTTGKLVVVSGEGLKAMEASDRIAFFQLLSAGGCRTALAGRTEEPLQLDLSRVGSLVCGPNDYFRVTDARELGQVPVTAVFIGGCSAGRIEDIRAIAQVVRGRRVNPRVRTTVAFASTQVYIQAANEGLIPELLDAGVVVMNQGCSACYGRSQGLTDDQDTVLSAGSRFSPNCAGQGEAVTYLCSAVTAMESAIAGCIRSAK